MVAALELFFFFQELLIANENKEIGAWLWCIVAIQMELVLYWFLHISREWTIFQLFLAVLSLTFTILYTYLFGSILIFHTHIEVVYYVLITVFITQTVISTLFLVVNIGKYRNAHADDQVKLTFKDARCLDISLNVILFVAGCLGIAVLSTTLLASSDSVLVFTIFFVIFRFLILFSCILMFFIIHDRTRSNENTAAVVVSDDSETPNTTAAAATATAALQVSGKNTHTRVKWERIAVCVVGQTHIGKSKLIRQLMHLFESHNALDIDKKRAGVSTNTDTQSEKHMVEIYRKWIYDMKIKTYLKIFDTVGKRRFIWQTLDCMTQSDILILMIDANDLYRAEEADNKEEEEDADRRHRHETSILFIQKMHKDIMFAYEKSKLDPPKFSCLIVHVNADNIQNLSHKDLWARTDKALKKFNEIFDYSSQKESEMVLNFISLAAGGADTLLTNAVNQVLTTLNTLNTPDTTSASLTPARRPASAAAEATGSSPSSPKSVGSMGSEQDIEVVVTEEPAFAGTKHVASKSAADIIIVDDIRTKTSGNVNNRTRRVSLFATTATLLRQRHGSKIKKISQSRDSEMEEKVSSNPNVNLNVLNGDNVDSELKELQETYKKDDSIGRWLHKIGVNSSKHNLAKDVKLALICLKEVFKQVEQKKQLVEMIKQPNSDSIRKNGKKGQKEVNIKKNGKKNGTQRRQSNENNKTAAAANELLRDLFELSGAEFDQLWETLIKLGGQEVISIRINAITGTLEQSAALSVNDERNEMRKWLRYKRGLVVLRHEWKKQKMRGFRRLILDQLHQVHQWQYHTENCIHHSSCKQYAVSFAQMTCPQHTATIRIHPLPEYCERRLTVFMIQNERASQEQMNEMQSNCLYGTQATHAHFHRDVSSAGPRVKRSPHSAVSLPGLHSPGSPPKTKETGDSDHKDSAAAGAGGTHFLSPVQSSHFQYTAASRMSSASNWNFSLMASSGAQEIKEMKQMMRSLRGPVGSTHFWKLKRPAGEILGRFVVFYVFGLSIPFWIVFQTVVFWLYSDEWGFKRENNEVASTLLKYGSIDRYRSFFLDLLYPMFPRVASDPRQQSMLDSGLRSFTFVKSDSVIDFDSFFRQKTRDKLARVFVTGSVLLFFSFIYYNLNFFFKNVDDQLNTLPGVHVSKVEMVGGFWGFAVVWLLASTWLAHSVKTLPDLDTLFTKQTLQDMKIVYMYRADGDLQKTRRQSNLYLFLQSYSFYRQHLTSGRVFKRVCFLLIAVLFSLAPGLARLFSTGSGEFLGDASDGPQRNVAVRAIVINFILVFAWLYLFDESLYKYFKQYSDLMTKLTELIEISSSKTGNDSKMERAFDQEAQLIDVNPSSSRSLGSDDWNFDKNSSFMFLSLDHPQNFLSWYELRSFAYLRGKQLFAELELFVAVSVGILFFCVVYLVWKVTFLGQIDTKGQTQLMVFLVTIIISLMLWGVLKLGSKFDKLQDRQVQALLHQIYCIQMQKISNSNDVGPEGWRKFCVETWIRNDDVDDNETSDVFDSLFGQYMSILENGKEQLQHQSINPKICGFGLNSALMVTLVTGSLSAIATFVYPLID